MKNFSHDWFARHVTNWETYVIPNLPEKPVCLEIGAFEGLSTCWIMDNIKPSSLTVVDTWKGSEEHEGMGIDNTNTYQTYLENTKEYKNIHNKTQESFRFLIEDNSWEIAAIDLRKNPPGSYDFIHVDGSHRARDVFFDACLSWELLKNGGIIVFDDYDWVKYTHQSEPWRTPRPALDGFLASFKDEIEILHCDYQLILKKIV